jgi:P4 family phage/plasmid primase-like protien
MSSSSVHVAKNQKFSRADVVALIRESLSVLAAPGQTVELRIPGIQGKRTDSGYFNDLDTLAKAAATYEGKTEGVYITVNPVQPALLARSSNRVKEYAKQTTSDKDVLRRRWIFIDFDPVRPAGISSSDDENAAALEHATACRERLSQRGIPSVLANSGNGAHLLIPVDLPNDEASTELVRKFLALVDSKFSDTKVKVDTGMVGASHLIKLYGTLACKGDNIPERPHRRSAIVDVPECLDPVETTLLEKLIASATPAAPSPSASNTSRPTQTNNNSADTSSDHTFIDTVKARFDMVAYAERTFGVQAVVDGKEVRLPGNGGFLINLEKGTWFHHSEHTGGDALDLVGHCLFGATWNNRNGAQFREVLREAANFAGVPFPERRPEQPAKPSSSSAPDAEPAPAKSDNSPKLDLLDLAQLWRHKHGNDLAWDADRSAWRRWTNTHWQLQRTDEGLHLQAAQMLHQVGVSVSTTNKTDGMLKYARGLCVRPFKGAKHLVNFQNGTLPLDSLQLRAHERTDGLTHCLPFAYEPEHDYPQIRQFLSRAIPDEIGQRAYMTHVGAALVGDTSLHKVIVLFGAPRSGKTTLLKLAQLALGYKPGAFATSTLFSPESRGANSRATWVDSTPGLVCLDEFPQDALQGEGEELFKSMTSHGGVSMWLKYQDEREENTWTPKLMFATNNRLRYRDQSGALTKRLLILECPNALCEAKQDGNLLFRLQPELGAFAAACIQLALEAQHNRKYPESAQMRSLLTDIETNGDALKLWLAERCVVAEGAFESTATLYTGLRLWCEENGLNPVSRPKMRDVLTTYHPNVKATRRRVMDDQTGEIALLWGLDGLRLRTPEDDFAELDAMDEADETTTPSRSSDPIDEFTGSVNAADNDAVCVGDPVDSQNYSDPVETEAGDENAEEVVEIHRITGSGQPSANADAQGYCERPLFEESGTLHHQASEALRHHPDLAQNRRR